MNPPSPSQTSTRTSLSPTPTESTGGSESMHSFDLSLDPSDPLNFLLAPDSSLEDSSSSSHDSPSEFQPLWHAPQASLDNGGYKWQSDIPQLSLDGSAMNIDYGFDPSSDEVPFQFDPSFFNEAALSLGLDLTQIALTSASPHELLSTPDPHAFAFSELSHPTFQMPSRRQSITSASSSSGASFSPVIEKSGPPLEMPDTGDRGLLGDSTINDLAHRARQRAGVMMAVQMPTSADSVTQQQSQPKLPIPRLVRPPAAPSTKRRASASQNPTPPQSNASTPPPSTVGEAPVFSNSKPKTSHTTIERRYRTNLNARIQALRAAVPALRVLEQRDGNRVGNLGLRVPEGDPGAGGDVVDERGFVDGVKVARKGSKANVLGKAVEYIRVLKRRELRLKREQDGLKSLLFGLVGGPALLREWEKEWVERYGGAERDEVDAEGEDAEADDENDMDDMDDDDDDDDDGRKKRKRTKGDGAGTKAAKGKKEGGGAKKAVVRLGANEVAPLPEKRKRGRPRKVPAPAPQQTDVKMEDVAPEVQEQAEALPQAETLAVLPPPQPGQYLLATFAFFSFFNTPMPFATRRHEDHTHAGAVLSPMSAPSAAAAGTVAPIGWRDALQMFHLLVSALLLFSVVAPWLPRTIRTRVSRVIPSLLKPLVVSYTVQAPMAESATVTDDDKDEAKMAEKEEAKTRLALISALQLRYQGRRAPTPSEEAQALRDALGMRGGVTGLVSAVPRMIIRGSGRTGGLGWTLLERRAWIRLAEVVALDAKASWVTRLQTYFCASRFISASSSCAADLVTLALIIYPYFGSKGTALWELARTRTQSTVCVPFEGFVLDGMSVDDAVELIARSNQTPLADMAQELGEDDGEKMPEEESQETDAKFSPLAILAARVVRDHVRRQSEEVFLQSVLGEETETDKEGAEKRDANMHRVVAAGRSLGNRTVTLVELFEKVCNPTMSHLAQPVLPDEHGRRHGEEDYEDSDLFDLLNAIVLYRRIFPSTLLQLPQTGDERACGPSSAATSSISISLIPMPSPPPSPSRKNAALHLALRRALDSSAFDRGDVLEDARDHVVDMLTTSETGGWLKRRPF